MRGASELPGKHRAGRLRLLLHVRPPEERELRWSLWAPWSLRPGAALCHPPPLNGDSITEYEVGVCEDEDWDDDQLLGFEPCNENLISGCNIINGRCECSTIRTCNNPFEFPRKDMCLSALKRIEEEKPDCTKARCEVQFSPRCPEDSILIEGYAPPGSVVLYPAAACVTLRAVCAKSASRDT